MKKLSREEMKNLKGGEITTDQEEGDGCVESGDPCTTSGSACCNRLQTCKNTGGESGKMKCQV